MSDDRNAYRRAWRAANAEREKASRKAYREKHADTIAAQRKAWKAANPEASSKHNRARNLKRYGLSEESYEQMWQAQEGRCLICSRQMLRDGREEASACVDHAHDSLQVRGLLCRGCNTGLGNFYERPEVLEAAIRYLRAHGR